MKIKHIAGLIAATITTLPVVEATESFVVISPNLGNKSTINQVYRSVLTSALKDIKPGDKITIVDGWVVRPVTQLVVPDHKAYAKNPKQRAKAMKAGIATFGKWLTRANATCPQGGIQTPAVYEWLATHTSISENNGKVLLIGSSIYHNPAEEAFSLQGGYYPSDAHLAVDRSESEFGLKDAKSRLAGVTIHWCSTGSVYQDSGHRANVMRWWALYTQEQGAVLASFNADAGTVTKRFDAGIKNPILTPVANATGKVEMVRTPIRIRIQRPEPPAEVETDSQGETASAPATAPPVAPPTADSKPSINFMLTDRVETSPPASPVVKGCRIGIRWPGARDLDLYVRSQPRAKELYYKVNRSAEGIHVKDWLTSPDVENNGFETVELRADVDLRQLTLAVNFYAGSHSRSGVDGTIRVEIDGKVYQAPFHVKSTRGNKGSGRTGNRASSDYWTVLDPLKIVGLR